MNWTRKNSRTMPGKRCRNWKHLTLSERERMLYCMAIRELERHISPRRWVSKLANVIIRFTSVPKLLVQIREARSAKTLGILQNKFEKYDLVICDEFGYVSCDKEGGEMLFNHLSLRSGKKATIITTNLAFNRWNEIIKDKVLVAAMVDRLTHKAFLLNMSGQSYRLKETQKTMRG